MTKTSKQIQAFILKRGNKLTNAEMATKLEVPRMTFAGVLAAMKRNGSIPSGFLKSDAPTATKKAAPKKAAKKAAKRK